MENIIMKNDVIQKIIDLMSWKIIAASKGYCRTIKQGENISNMDVLQELLKEEIAHEKNLSYENLYYWLSSTVLDVCSARQIENILRCDIKEHLKGIETQQMVEIFNGKRKDIDRSKIVLSYEELCKMLLNKLSLLPIREKSSDDNWVDLFVICTKDGRLVSIEEVENEWLGENINKRVLTQDE